MFGTLLEKLFVSIGADLSDLKEDMSDVKGIIGGVFKELDTDLASIGKGIEQTGKNLTASLTTPILGIGAASLKAAADAEEMESMFDAVFRDMADSTRTWAEEHATAVNRSRFDLQEYAANLQDTFVPLGVARDKATEMSKAVVELAVDVASFKNASEGDVINDFQSAIVGNTETVRKYGIVITQATLNQELLRQGVEGGVKAATEQEKAQARVNLIMSQTSDAHGDAARTADSLTNQVKGMTSQLGEAAILIGQDLIPIAKELTAVIVEKVKAFNALDEETRRNIIRIAAMVAAIGPLLIIGGKLIGTVLAIKKAIMTARVVMIAWAAAMNTALGPIGLVIAALGLLVAAYVKWGGATNAAMRAHRDLYDLIDQSQSIRDQDVGNTEEAVKAQLEEAKAIREKIKAKLEEKKLLLETQLANAQTYDDPRFQLAGQGDPSAQFRKQAEITSLAIKQGTEEYAEQEAKVKELNAALAGLVKKKEDEAEAETKRMKAREEASKVKEDDASAKLKKKHEDTVNSIKGEVEANRELAAALRVSQEEYEVTAKMLELFASGFQGSSEEARKLAMELRTTEETMKSIQELQASDALVENIEEQIEANLQLAEAAKISTHELQIQETVMQLLTQGFKGSAEEARKLAEDLIASQNALAEARTAAEDTATKTTEKVKKDVADVGTDVTSVFQDLFKGVNLEEGIKGLGSKLLESLKGNILDGVLPEFGSLLDSAMSSLFGGLGQGITGILGGIFGGSSSGGGGIFGSLLGGIAGAVFGGGKSEQVGTSVKSAASISTTFVMPPGTDMAEFRKSESQIGSVMSRAIGRGQRNS